MDVAFFKPLTNAWQRMVRALFKPFDIGKWFALGFTAFLAELLDWTDGGTGSDDGPDDHTFDNVIDALRRARIWVENNPEWFALIVAGVVLLVIALVIFAWLSSRGKFMFLDNVVLDRALIRKPWNEYRELGNSLFLWRLTYGIIILLIFVLFFGHSFLTIYNMQFDFEGWDVMTIVWLVVTAAVLFIITGYISLFLDDFVVPLMYRNNKKTMPAWRDFLTLFSQHKLEFILYGLFIFLLYILIIGCVIIFGLVTCCIGIVLLIIPYIGSVIMLPVSFTFRAYSLEFLQQFGPEYVLFPAGSAGDSTAVGDSQEDEDKSPS